MLVKCRAGKYKINNTCLTTFVSMRHHSDVSHRSHNNKILPPNKTHYPQQNPQLQKGPQKDQIRVFNQDDNNSDWGDNEPSDIEADHIKNSSLSPSTLKEQSRVNVRNDSDQGSRSNSISTVRRGMKLHSNRATDSKLQKLSNVEVSYKKIEDYETEERLKMEARQFTIRLQKQKQEMNGKYYYIRLKQDLKKKQLERQKKNEEMLRKSNEKLQKLKEREQRIEFFRQRTSERQHQVRKMRLASKNSNLSLSIHKNCTYRPKVYEEPQQKPVPSKSIQMGNSYLKNYGKIKRRAVTQSADYQLLDPEEIEQLEKVRKKIDELQILLYS